MCSPHLSRLSSSLVSSHLLAVEAARQEKLRKKLEKRVEAGAITEQEKLAQLDRVDRETGEGQSLVQKYLRLLSDYHIVSPFSTNSIETISNSHRSLLDSFQLLGADRGTRKRQQVENIAALLRQHQMETKKVVVDFGSGSGNLCLVLASFYRHSTFVFVDQNEKSLGKKISIIFIKSQNSK